MRRARSTDSGQAVLEFVIFLPVFVLVCLGAFDLGHIVSDATYAPEAARAGIITAITSPTSNVGKSIRSEAGSAFANNAATWGTLLTDSCTAIGNTTCGDTGGCAAGDSFWAGSPSATACFAIGKCSITSCGSPTWGSRPSSPTDNATVVVVRVTLKFASSTPLIGNLSGGTYYPTSTFYAIPEY